MKGWARTSSGVILSSAPVVSVAFKSSTHRALALSSLSSASALFSYFPPDAFSSGNSGQIHYQSSLPHNHEKTTRHSDSEGYFTLTFFLSSRGCNSYPLTTLLKFPTRFYKKVKSVCNNVPLNRSEWLTATFCPMVDVLIKDSRTSIKVRDTWQV